MFFARLLFTFREVIKLELHALAVVTKSEILKHNMLLLLVLSLILPVHSYLPAAQPLQVAKPNDDNVYEFDLVLTKKLTMSYSNDDIYRHSTPVDWNVDEKRWYKREPDQLKACNLSYPMNVMTDSFDGNRLQDVLSLDGLHRRVISINGHSPGLPIVVPYGSEVLMKVYNKLLLDSVTIHIHGLDKKNLWYTDGVAFVQQCPITSTTYYEYRFIADRIGTHWYHGHMQSDRGDGLLGGFVVVDEKNRTVPVTRYSRVTPDKEYLAMLQDWATMSNEESWMMLDEKIMKWMYGFDDNTQCWQPTRLRDGGNVGGAVPISAILINEKGWHNQDDVRKRPHSLPLEIFPVNENESVLFRIVNGGIAQELMVHVEGHQMTVVAADGSEVIPRNISRLIIFPGERYDILVHTLSNPTKKSYRFQVETIQFFNWDWTPTTNTYGLGFLEYTSVKTPNDESPPDLSPSDCTQQKPCLVLNCPFEHYAPEFNYTCLNYNHLQSPHVDRELVPEMVAPYNDSDFEEHFINMHFDSHVNGFKFEYPNGIPYYEETTLNRISKPCNTSSCPRGANKYDRNCNCFYHLRHKLGNIVQLTVYNMGQGGGYGTGYAHPFHIHGSHFYVVKVGWPSYNSTGFITDMNPDILCAGSDSVCDDSTWSDKSWLKGALPDISSNPVLRDNVLLPVGGYITIRFRADNPGWWFAHCHLVLHHMGGTAYAFKIGEDSEIPPPPDNFPRSCSYFKMDKIPSFSPTRPVKNETNPPTKSSSGIGMIFFVISAFVNLCTLN